MKNILRTSIIIMMAALPVGASESLQGKVYEETGGLVAVEAEHVVIQEADRTRKWYQVDETTTPDILPDGDGNHAATASGKAYLEALPDTRRSHDDPLVPNENFCPQPGAMAILYYAVYFNNPGRYYVWVRAYSTNTEDNGIHAGLDGEWPESGARMQWCDGKDSWRWESKQRTEKNHCGEPYKIYLDINEPGLHTISFSMREDGFEFDKWLMTTDKEYRPAGEGPAERLRTGN